MILKLAFTAIFAIMTAIIIFIINVRIEENETIFLTPDMVNETILI